MAVPPVPYRVNTESQQQYVASFPPPIYYRDTFGLQPLSISEFRLSESINSAHSDAESKSTVRVPMRIYHSIENNYGTTHQEVLAESQYTDQTQSYKVEQIITDQVLIKHPKYLLVLTLVAFGAALQLFIFAVISAFFEGAYPYASLSTSILFMATAFLLWCFLRYHHSRALLTVSILAAGVSILAAVVLFIMVTYLAHKEDKELWLKERSPLDEAPAARATGKSADIPFDNSNHIVRSTRLTMYSLLMIYSPLLAVCFGAILYILCVNWLSLPDGPDGQAVTGGYFFSTPAENQNVLVPITLKQVRHLDREAVVENTSIGVQTSGTLREAL